MKSKISHLFTFGHTWRYCLIGSKSENYSTLSVNERVPPLVSHTLSLCLSGSDGGDRFKVTTTSTSQRHARQFFAMLLLPDRHRLGCSGRDHHRRRRRNLAAQSVFFIFGFLAIYALFGSAPSRTHDRGPGSAGGRRHLLQTSGTDADAQESTEGGADKG